MATFKDYLEEETAYLPISDFPSQWLGAEAVNIIEGEFIFTTPRRGQESYKLLEVTLTDGEIFYAVAHENDEWLGYAEIEDYVAENFDTDLDYYDLEI